MAKIKKYGLRELRAEFPSDDACLDYLFDTLHTRACSCGGRYARISDRKQFQCSQCRFQIAPMVGTIFQKSSTPLSLWFHAILVFSNAKSGISAKQMERELNVTYKTAWRILHLIRQSLGQGKKKLAGTVEADEGFFGGKGDGGVYNENQSEVMKKKIKVVTAIQRKGEARSEVVPDVTAGSIGEFVERTVADGSTLMTDMSNRYPTKFYKREAVNHGRKEWVRGNVHINNVEAFNGHVKRSIKGVYKTVSKAYFQEYLNAFVWHRNNRHNDRMRFGALMGAIVRPV